MCKIIISKEDRDIVQRYDVEQTARKNLINFLLTENINNEERLKQFENEYIECFHNFEIAKLNIQKKYLDDKNIKYTDWYLNYITCELNYS